MCIICRTGSTYTTPTGETISGYVLTYDLKLYIDDFPLIKKQYEKYEKLNDEYESHMSELDHKIENAIESNDVIIYNNDIINDIKCKIDDLYKEVNQLKDKNYGVGKLIDFS